MAVHYVFHVSVVLVVWCVLQGGNPLRWPFCQLPIQPHVQEALMGSRKYRHGLSTGVS